MIKLFEESHSNAYHFFAVFTNYLFVIGKSKRVKKMIQYFSGPLLVGPDMKENGRMEIGTVKVHYFPGD